MVRLNVKMTKYVNGDPIREGNIYTYEHPVYLEEGTAVLVDVQGSEYEGEITYQGHAYDGSCKPILKVLSVPPPVVVV